MQSAISCHCLHPHWGSARYGCRTARYSTRACTCDPWRASFGPAERAYTVYLLFVDHLLGGICSISRAYRKISTKWWAKLELQPVSNRVETTNYVDNALEKVSSFQRFVTLDIHLRWIFIVLPHTGPGMMPDSQKFGFDGKFPECSSSHLLPRVFRWNQLFHLNTPNMSSGSYSFVDLHSDMETFALVDGSEGSAPWL